MENTNLIKGNKLETAVELIERAILNSDPSLRASNFNIERKKIIMNGGVRYEVDLYVEINQGFGYNSVFIFECKNWNKKVSRNEITEFAEKIDVAKAQKGFFIAKEYTSSAEARAKQDKRIDLLYFNNTPIDLTSFPQFEFFNKVNKIRSIEVREFGFIGEGKIKKQIIDFENCMMNYMGREGKFKDFITLLTEEMANEIMGDEKLNNLSEGKHSYESEKEFVFQRDDLFIKEIPLDREIEKIKIEVVFETELIRPKIVSKIDVLTRGRLIEFESVKTSAGGEIKFAFIVVNTQTKN